MTKKIRGYFGVGIEKSSKQMNAGNLFRTAHAFGASFLFTVNTEYSVKKAKSDTSLAPRNIPWYDFDSAEKLKLPSGCVLVGVEFFEESIELPVFRHPSNAAYIFGPEMGSLSSEILDSCKHLVKIPTNFSLNIATAGAIILYDRIKTIGDFGRRPIGSIETPPSPMKLVNGLIHGKKKNLR